MKILLHNNRTIKLIQAYNICVLVPYALNYGKAGLVLVKTPRFGRNSVLRINVTSVITINQVAHYIDFLVHTNNDFRFKGCISRPECDTPSRGPMISLGSYGNACYAGNIRLVHFM